MTQSNKHHFINWVFLFVLVISFAVRGNAQNQVTLESHPMEEGEHVQVQFKHSVNKTQKQKGGKSLKGGGRNSSELEITLDGKWTFQVKGTNKNGPSEGIVDYSGMGVNKSYRIGKKRKNEKGNYPVEGKSYYVQRKPSGKLNVHYTGKKEASLTEKEHEILRNQFRFLGKKTPLQQELQEEIPLSTGQTFTVSAAFLYQIIKGDLPGWSPDQTLTMTYKGLEKSEEQTAPRVRFELEGSAPIKGKRTSGNTSVKGTIELGKETGRLVSADVELSMKKKTTYKSGSSKPVRKIEDRTDKLDVTWDYN